MDANSTETNQKNSSDAIRELRVSFPAELQELSNICMSRDRYTPEMLEQLDDTKRAVILVATVDVGHALEDLLTRTYGRYVYFTYGSLPKDDRQDGINMLRTKYSDTLIITVPMLDFLNSRIFYTDDSIRVYATCKIWTRTKGQLTGRFSAKALEDLFAFQTKLEADVYHGKQT